MTEAQLREIWKKTNGHCHFCGDRISLRKRGFHSQRADGCWEVDHVIQRDKGGAGSVQNYLPACTSCNRLRWHRTGAELRDILIFGIIARRETELFKETGKQLIALRHQQVEENRRRRTGASLSGTRRIDPVQKAQVRQDERNILIDFLRKHLRRSFSAAQLSKHTGVPKGRIRQLMAASHKISVIGDGGRYGFQSRRPKKKRA